MCCWSVGLVQREIEAAGIPTISLSNIPDLTASVGVPRLVAIEHPENANVSWPGDYTGQMAVLRETLFALSEISGPGSVKYLSSRWLEGREKLELRLPQPPPIVEYLKHHPWALPQLIWRNPPQAPTRP